MRNLMCLQDDFGINSTVKTLRLVTRVDCDPLAGSGVFGL